MKLQWLKAAMVRGVAVLIVLFAVQYVFNSDSRAKYFDLRADLDRLHQITTDLGIENERLRLQIEGIQHDERYLEQVARQEFGMIRKGEVLYRFLD